MLIFLTLLGDDPVEVRNIKEAFEKSYGPYRLKSDSLVVTCCLPMKKTPLVKKRVAVLISGSGKYYLKLAQRLNHVEQSFAKTMSKCKLLLYGNCSC